MGLGSFGLGIANSVKSAEAAEEANRLMKEKRLFAKQMRLENDKIFNKQYYQNITDRTDVQNMMKMIEENQRKQRVADEASAAVTGASGEQLAAAQESRNKSQADMYSSIVNNVSQLKDAYMNQHRQDIASYYNALLNSNTELAGMRNSMAAELSKAGSKAFDTAFNMMGKGIDSMMGMKRGSAGTMATT